MMGGIAACSPAFWSDLRRYLTLTTSKEEPEDKQDKKNDQ